VEAFSRFVQNVEERFVRVVVTKNAVKNTEPMIQNIVNGTVVIEVFDFDRLNTHPTNGCCIGTHEGVYEHKGARCIHSPINSNRN